MQSIFNQAQTLQYEQQIQSWFHVDCIDSTKILCIWGTIPFKRLGQEKFCLSAIQSGCSLDGSLTAAWGDQAVMTHLRAIILFIQMLLVD